MSRRTVAGLLAIGLIAVLVVAAAQKPVPYVVFRPGPTVNVLGKYANKPIITIQGRKSYPDTGQLRMVTVYVTGPESKITLFDLVTGWIDRDVTLLPHDAVYQPDETPDSAKQESAVQMTTSQDAATAAALSALDIKYRTGVAVAQVVKGGASEGILKPNDELRTINGATISSSDAVVSTVQKLAPGSKVTLGILRAGKPRTVVVTTRADPTKPKLSRINVSVGGKYVFPFRVSVGVGDDIGGPSAGMMFALSIYDLLTPGSLTDGKVIAGSGTIDPQGVVGPIGGIGQKLVAAQRDGAKLFLVSDENCAEAAASHYDRDTMELVKVHTLKDAISDVAAWSKDPNAKLTRCTR
ncbi:MAG: hypothetical protein JWQ74_542 [Marmoricola sp.]|nr:hypothetical protein [Marmoricola sp.]